MAPARNGRNLRSYRRKAKKTLRAMPGETVVCWICGEPIDLTLHYQNPMAGTADHLDAVGTGGHILGELRPAHRSCNSRRGTGQDRHQPTQVSSAW